MHERVICFVCLSADLEGRCIITVQRGTNLKMMI